MGFLKFTLKRTAAKLKAARLLTYVGRPKKVRQLKDQPEKNCFRNQLNPYWCIIEFDLGPNMWYNFYDALLGSLGD